MPGRESQPVAIKDFGPKPREGRQRVGEVAALVDPEGRGNLGGRAGSGGEMDVSRICTENGGWGAWSLLEFELQDEGVGWMS